MFARGSALNECKHKVQDSEDQDEKFLSCWWMKMDQADSRIAPFDLKSTTAVQEDYYFHVR